MPISPIQIDHEEILEVVADRAHVLRVKSNFIEDAYFTVNSRGQKYVRPGLILAQETTTKKYVPYHATAQYGVGSDTAVAVLDEFLDLTLGEEAVDPIFHGKLIEAHAYVWNGDLGTVADAIKTDLQMVKWV